MLKPGVFNLNRLKIIIMEDEKAKNHFVNEIRLPDDILINVIDSNIES